jgi:hypothetical protein
MLGTAMWDSCQLSQEAQAIVTEPPAIGANASMLAIALTKPQVLQAVQGLRPTDCMRVKVGPLPQGWSGHLDWLFGTMAPPVLLRDGVARIVETSVYRPDYSDYTVVVRHPHMLAIMVLNLHGSTLVKVGQSGGMGIGIPSQDILHVRPWLVDRACDLAEIQSHRWTRQELWDCLDMLGPVTFSNDWQMPPRSSIWTGNGGAITGHTPVAEVEAQWRHIYNWDSSDEARAEGTRAMRNARAAETFQKLGRLATNKGIGKGERYKTVLEWMPPDLIVDPLLRLCVKNKMVPDYQAARPAPSRQVQYTQQFLLLIRQIRQTASPHDRPGATLPRLQAIPEAEMTTPEGARPASAMPPDSKAFEALQASPSSTPVQPSTGQSRPGQASNFMEEDLIDLGGLPSGAFVAAAPVQGKVPWDLLTGDFLEEVRVESHLLASPTDSLGCRASLTDMHGQADSIATSGQLQATLQGRQLLQKAESQEAVVGRPAAQQEPRQQASPELTEGRPVLQRQASPEGPPAPPGTHWKQWRCDITGQPWWHYDGLLGQWWAPVPEPGSDWDVQPFTEECLPKASPPASQPAPRQSGQQYPVVKTGQQYRVGKTGLMIKAPPVAARPAPLSPPPASPAPASPSPASPSPTSPPPASPSPASPSPAFP